MSPENPFFGVKKSKVNKVTRHINNAGVGHGVRVGAGFFLLVSFVFARRIGDIHHATSCDIRASS